MSVRDSEYNKKDELTEIVIDSLKDLVNKGIDKKALEASINFGEFQMREFDTRLQPKGISINAMILDSYNYGGDPFVHLEFEKTA